MIGNLLDATLLGLANGTGIAALHYVGGRLKRGRRLRDGALVSAKKTRPAAAPPTVMQIDHYNLRRPEGDTEDKALRSVVDLVVAETKEGVLFGPKA